MSSSQTSKTVDKPKDAKAGRFAARLPLAFLTSRLSGLAGGRKGRSAAIAGVLLLLIAGTLAAWTYLARVALHSGQVPLQVVLDALDQGHVEQARALATRMLSDGSLPRSEYGGPLYALGAIKTYDAETNPSPDKRRVDFLVASRYLKEAGAYGFPPGREAAGAFLLGKSLLESNQFDEGIEALDALLSGVASEPGPLSWAIHRELATACIWMPAPRLEKALDHNLLALENPQLTPEARADLLIEQAQCLARLGRYDDAQTALATVPDQSERTVLARIARAEITLLRTEAELNATAAQEKSGVLARANPEIDNHLRGLVETSGALDDGGVAALRVKYLVAQLHRLRGEAATALAAFTHIRQFHPETPEGVAAALFEAELQRKLGDTSAAVLGYRRALETIHPATHRGHVLSLSQVRRMTVEALVDFRDQRQFAAARSLLNHFVPLFSRTEELLLRGELLQRWGELLLGQAEGDEWARGPEHEQGRRLLREAGMAFEDLSELRFATESYTNDLWAAAENYYRGHSFSRAARVIELFLANEPQLRNAQALLRLGQCHLSLGKIKPSIAALEECIEFYPQDNATYQARIDCAKANWYVGDLDAAERHLRHNLSQSNLKPTSREWKDSLFELGMLLYDKRDYEKAIDTLAAAIERYPNDSQTLLAQYVVGVSYRSWAEEEQLREQTTRTAAEREKHSQLVNGRLNAALDYFLNVQRKITLSAHDVESDPMKRAMLRNCYMLAGAVMYDLGRYDDAIDAYSNVSSLYPNDPFVLETFVQIANCRHRLKQVDKARGAIQQAKIAFDRLPPDADFASSTARTRDEWRLLLNDMERW